MRLVHQFEVEVVLDSELDSKSNSGILNWIESPLWCAHLLPLQCALDFPLVLIIISMIPNNN
jgi:hypothetical protein